MRQQAERHDNFCLCPSPRRSPGSPGELPAVGGSSAVSSGDRSDSGWDTSGRRRGMGDGPSRDADDDDTNRTGRAQRQCSSAEHTMGQRTQTEGEEMRREQERTEMNEVKHEERREDHKKKKDERRRKRKCGSIAVSPPIARPGIVIGSCEGKKSW